MAAATATTRGTAVGCGCPLPLPCQCSYPALLRARLRAALATEPLLRNGHVLTASSLLTAGLGGLFWLLASAWYGPAAVGRGYAALAAAALLSGIGQFNLGDVLMRFVPTAGRHTRRLLLRCYAVSSAATVLAAGAFLLLVPVLAPELDFLRTPVVAVAFVAAAAGYTLFVLQDGALTGLRRPGWVLGENALFAVAKAALLGLCVLLPVSGVLPGSGILLAWSAALLLSLLVTNAYLFGRAVPAHARAGRDAARPAGLVRYAAADYLGALLRTASFSVLPLLVLGRLGAEQSAYFSLAWVIAYTLQLVALNMGSSLIVEAAHAPERLAAQARRVLRHSAPLIGAGAALLVVTAPWLLSLFGPGYAEHGTTALRLLALSALPNLVLGLAVDVCRARRAMRRVVALQAALLGLVLLLTLLLIPPLGITGVALAWLIAESTLALALLATTGRWLPKGR
ncbi:lipopolysaccharide biosynthesis protein [Kitasatospora sp. NPDC051853]|uniref:lipopolysaccharide biosynthesis protein n=1 Tax=Kitasatospora sp. NPDC051853 TaxID=3364058 RepID=UPI00379DC856